MSKIGRQVIPLPQGVTLKVNEHNVCVSGPKGILERPFPSSVSIEDKEGNIVVKSQIPALWGTWRAHVANMVTGVSNGFRKQLKVQGVGYRVQQEGTTLTLALGFSHPIKVSVPEGLVAEVKENSITISGTDKEKVGQFASSVRSLRPPDHYKGKGIRYENEVVKLKPGKKVGTAGG